MNFLHFLTVSWLRWRLVINPVTRQSKWMTIMSVILLIYLFAQSLMLCVCSWYFSYRFKSGPLTEVTADPILFSKLILYLWGGISLVFTIGWFSGVVAELQRKEPLSLRKFLHLPVKPRVAFAINFLSSFTGFTMLLIFPVMVGVILGMLNVFGIRAILAIPLLLSFLFFMGATTYQFRGWLAFLMADKRRYRKTVGIMTFIAVMIAIAPAIYDITDAKTIIPGMQPEESNTVKQARDALADLESQVRSKTLLPADFEASANLHRETIRDFETIQTNRLTRSACALIPFGWLTLGMEQLVTGTHWYDWFLVPFCCFVGYLCIGIFSLNRSYKTTLRMYRGEEATTSDTISNTTKDGSSPRFSALAAATWPLHSGQQSSIASTTLLSLLRATEARIALLTPYIMMLLIGGSFAWRNEIDQNLRPFAAIGVATFAMMGIMQLVNNMFGFDRDGFRALIFSPVNRRDILLGKNLAFAPFAIGMGGLGILSMQVFFPMPFTHVIATFFQLCTTFLITCLLGNWMSIKTPLAIAPGSLKPANLRLGTFVLQLLFTALLPICMIPVMIPPAIDLLVRKTTNFGGVPVYLILSIGLLSVTLMVYRLVINQQAKILADDEKDILKTVTEIGF